MHIITDTADLTKFCRSLAQTPYITIDTEFIREKTYYPVLCLIQVAGPDQEAAIDPLAEGMDLAPLYELLMNPKVLKVFHACRQDIEIFYQKTGRIPTPMFDTQIAAMVCGFGESVGYESLVGGLLGQPLDKSSRFTDWAHRPLSEKQIAYALADVTHLRFVYERLSETIADKQRAEWIAEEMAALSDPKQYEVLPEEAWIKLRYRPRSRKILGTLQAIGAWREREAQQQNVPRGRILRDDLVIAVAEANPANLVDLQRVRGLNTQMSSRRLQSLADAIAEATHAPTESHKPPQKDPLPEGAAAVIDLLRLLLKRQCEMHGVASKLVANRDDLEMIYRSGGHAEIPALHGWRYEVFGRYAQALMQGKMTFEIDPKTKLLTIHDV